MAIGEKQIRQKIFERIIAVCPDAKRIKRNPFTRDRSEWAGLFRHEITVGSETKTVTHAWVVRRSAYPKQVKSRIDKFVFELLGFYGFDYGTDENNSEDVWQKYLDDLAEEFADDEIWDFGSEPDEVTTDDLEFRPIGLIRTGDNEFLHFAGGRLTLNIHRC